MFVAVIQTSDEVQTQKELDALNAVCDDLGAYLRIESDAPQDLDAFTKELVTSCNAKVVK